MIYRIRNWNSLYENNRTRDLKRLDWVPLPNRMDGDGYTELLDHENGTSHLGAWVALVQIASRCDVRGTLLRGRGIPHDFRSLSRISRVPVAVLQEAVPRFVSMGWLEVVSGNGILAAHDDAEIPHDPAPECGNPAPSCDNEGKGMEGNGMEGKRVCVLPKIPESGWRTDESFDALVSAYRESGCPVIDEDFSDAWWFCWRTLDFEQKLDRVKAFQNRISAGAYGDPAMIPRPRKFIDREWKRPIVMPKAKASNAWDKADAILAERERSNLT